MSDSEEKPDKKLSNILVMVAIAGAGLSIMVTMIITLVGSLLVSIYLYQSHVSDVNIEADNSHIRVLKAETDKLRVQCAIARTSCATALEQMEATLSK